ncbi:hypothetical protein E2C01_081686 [Portunus trituberculatus]|uniref:Uncharacterized protein n=1 Tax=Portunus trituberculatus TaxID=210409 RepID=A0A5B7IQF2_PORTR|nr:hypothetical protein [Portunus trituberculatus]
MLCYVLQSVTLFTVTSSEAAKTLTVSIQREPEMLVAASSLASVDSKQSGFRAKVLLIHAQDTKEDALESEILERSEVRHSVVSLRDLLTS